MKKLMTDASYHIVGNFISKFTFILINLILAHRLSLQEYGQYSYLQNTLMTFSSIGLMGIASAVTYFFAKNKPRLALDSLLYLMLFLNILSIVGYAIYSLFYVSTVLSSILFFTLVFIINHGIISGACIGAKYFKVLSLVNILSSVLIALYFLVVEIKGFSSAICFYAFYRGMLFLFTILAFVYLYQIEILKFKFNFKTLYEQLKELYTFSLPIGLSSLLVAPTLWFGNTVLVESSDGQSEFGLFSFAYQIYMVVIFIPVVLSGFFLSYFSSEGIDKDRLYLKAVLFGFLFTTAMCILMFVFQTIYFNFYDDKLAKIQGFIFYLYVAATIYSVSSVVGQKILSNGDVWTGFKFNLIWALSFLGLVIFKVRYGKASDLAISLMFSYAIQLFFQLVYLHRKNRNSRY